MEQPHCHAHTATLLAWRWRLNRRSFARPCGDNQYVVLLLRSLRSSRLSNSRSSASSRLFSSSSCSATDFHHMRCEVDSNKQVIMPCLHFCIYAARNSEVYCCGFIRRKLRNVCPPHAWRCCACASAAAASAAVMGCCLGVLLPAEPLPPPASIRKAEKAACAAGTRPKSATIPHTGTLPWYTLWLCCHRADTYQRSCTCLERHT